MQDLRSGMAFFCGKGTKDEVCGCDGQQQAVISLHGHKKIFHRNYVTRDYPAMPHY